MSKSSRGRTVTRTQVAVKSEQFSGPLPPPAVLEHYNEILPGSAERIMKMAENEQAHRHVYEGQVINTEIKLNYTGLIMGFIVALAGIFCGTTIILKGQPLAGSAVVGIPLVYLVGLFINRHRNKQ